MEQPNIEKNEKFSVIRSSSSWIEGAALLQLAQVSNFEHMDKCVGLPDLHPGKGAPVGAAFLSKNDYIYPYLIGGDIGCGMSVAVFPGLNSRQLNQSKMVKKIKKLEKTESQKFESDLGFVGGGNHFVEMQKVVDILIPGVIEKDDTLATIHSGSRGLGAYILNQYVSRNNSNCVEVSTELGQWYLGEHEKAIDWAKNNRAALLDKLSICLGEEAKEILDIHHNYLEKAPGMPGQWLHRKGAASSHNELAIIPGSRGDYSYLVRPKANSVSLDSIAHGAGRRWMRSNCKCMLEDKFSVQSLEKTKLGSVVICEDKDLIYEEAPQAYKKISQVIDDLLAFDLIEVVAIVAPVITYKTAN